MLRQSLSGEQIEAALEIHETGYREFYMFPYAGRNKPAWKLVDMGLAIMDFGPRNSFLMTYCFMPVWSDPII